jgi:FkbM family methyltransferase
VASESPPTDARESSWKQRYATLRSRLTEMKTELDGVRQSLHASLEREQAVREQLAAHHGRLHRHERQVLRPEVLADLLPVRARYRRESAPDEAALRREAAHVSASEAYAAARAAAAPGGADHVEIAGITWWVPADNRIEGQLADRVLRRKHLPLQDILRTREAISNGTMLDIGANIGLTSVTRAMLGDASLIYAAEPAPDNFACLVRTVFDNGLQGIVLPDRVAISDRDGTASLRISGSIGGHALREGVPGLDVTTMRLDSWIEKLGIDVRAICYVKVDTQGYESHVLDGAPDLLARAGIVWELEFAPLMLPKVGREPAAVIERIQAAFTHFIDLNGDAPGARRRPVAELGEAVSYLERGFTNLLLYHGGDTGT